MSSLKKYITEETPIICTKPSYFFEALDDKNKTIYYKDFNINEFLGQQLSKIRNLKTNEYFLMTLKNEYKISKYKNIQCEDISDIKVASYDFKKLENQYYYLKELKLGENKLTELLKLCPNEKNKKELINEILELFALDTYMGQTDRYSYNIMFEVNHCGEIHLCPIYDYEYSMNDLYTQDRCIYPNALCTLDKIYEYKKLLEKYPQLYTMLNSYLDVNIQKEIIECFNDQKLSYEKVNFKAYSKFTEKRCKVIEKILK